MSASGAEKSQGLPSEELGAATAPAACGEDRVKGSANTREI